MTFDLRPYFQPVQPATEKSENVTYQEIFPAEELSSYIFCYWQLKSVNKLSTPYHYRVVTDGCVDIFFEINPSSECYIMGFSSKYVMFPLSNAFHYCGIRFFPMAFPILFDKNAQELSDQFQKLSIIHPDLTKHLSQKIAISTEIKQLAPQLNSVLSRYLPPSHPQGDERVYAALVEILQSHGALDIEREINVGLSARQLRRLFKYYIGCTPKLFSKVIRFQHVLQSKPSSASLKNNPIFYDVGYYDQAHFIKEFKTLFGTTPTKAFD